MCPGDRCDHPWCGTPILMTSIDRESVATIVARYGVFNTEEALMI